MEEGEGISDDFVGSWSGLEDDYGDSVYRVTRDPQLVDLGCCSGNKRGERDMRGGDCGSYESGLTSAESGRFLFYARFYSSKTREWGNV